MRAAMSSQKIGDLESLWDCVLKFAFNKTNASEKYMHLLEMDMEWSMLYFRMLFGSEYRVVVCRLSLSFWLATLKISCMISLHWNSGFSISKFKPFLFHSFPRPLSLSCCHLHALVLPFAFCRALQCLSRISIEISLLSVSLSFFFYSSSLSPSLSLSFASLWQSFSFLTNHLLFFFSEF